MKILSNIISTPEYKQQNKNKSIYSTLVISSATTKVFLKELNSSLSHGPWCLYSMSMCTSLLSLGKIVPKVTRRQQSLRVCKDCLLHAIKFPDEESLSLNLMFIAYFHLLISIWSPMSTMEYYDSDSSFPNERTSLYDHHVHLE